MARKPRLHVAGGVYHVMVRGNGGQDIFFDEGDWSHVYLLLQQGIERYGHRVHGFCCMPNHIHFVMQVQDMPLSQIMQNLSFRYTRWINTHQARSGHLFQGRYKAILVDADQYLLQLIRYIHLNPVRAGLVKDPMDYPWSSHRAYLGQEELPWLWRDWVLSYFAKRATTARHRYAAFVHEGKSEGHRAEFHQGGDDGRVLADDQFLEHVLGKENTPRPAVALPAIIACISRAYDVNVEELRGPARTRVLSEARKTIGWLARHFGTATIQEVAAYFHRDASTFSRHIGQLDAAVRGGEGAMPQLSQYIHALTQA